MGAGREDQVIVIHGQEVCLACLEPAPGRSGLTLWAMPVTTRVVGNLGVVAGLALQHMTAEFGTAAALNGRHDLELTETHVPGLSATPSRPVGAEDVRDL